MPFRKLMPVLVLLALVASGCGGSGGEGSGNPGTTDAQGNYSGVARPDTVPVPEEPQTVDITGKYGGRYVSTVRQDPKTWNALMANEASTTTFTSGPLYGGIVTWDYITQEYEPDLATAWEVDETGTVWTFTLRRGARWSDGAPYGVDDVIFTMDLVYDETVHPSVAELCKVQGEPFGYEKVDDHTVRFTLPGTYAAFLEAISSVRIMPEHALRDAYENGTFVSAFGVNTPPEEIVTSGPWRVKRYYPQERVVLEPNPYYHRFDRDGKRLPYLDELVYLVVPDQNAELLKFQSGESDELYFRAEDYASMKDGEAEGNYTVIDMGQEMGTNFFWLNQNLRSNPDTGEPFVDPVKLKWFRDREFRRALSHAVDRDGIVETVFYGIAEPLYGSIPPVNRKWHNPDILRFPYDPDKAKAALDAAGYRDRDGDGFREDPEGNRIAFTILTQPDNRERQGMCNILKDDFARVGIDLTVATVEFNTIIQKLRTTWDYDCILLGLTGGVPPSAYTSQNVWQSSGRTHFWSPEQPEPSYEWEAEIDHLMEEVVSARTEEEAIELFNRVQRIVSEEQPATYLVSRRGLIAIRNHFAGLQPSVMRPWVLWASERICYDPPRAKRELAGMAESH